MGSTSVINANQSSSFGLGLWWRDLFTRQMERFRLHDRDDSESTILPYRKNPTPTFISPPSFLSQLLRVSVSHIQHTTLYYSSSSTHIHTYNNKWDGNPITDDIVSASPYQWWPLARLPLRLFENGLAPIRPEYNSRANAQSTRKVELYKMHISRQKEIRKLETFPSVLLSCLCRSAEIFPFSSNFRRKKVSPNVENVCNSNRFISALDLIFVFLRETKSRLHLFRVRDIISSLENFGGKITRSNRIERHSLANGRKRDGELDGHQPTTPVIFGFFR